MEIDPTTTLGDVTQILERSPEIYPVLNVQDALGMQLGVVSDCHIRFGFMWNLTKDDSIQKLIDLYEEIDADARHVRLNDLNNAVKDNVAKGTLDPGGSGKLKYSALIMAGGFGTRLGHLTAETPKPLIDIAGRPLIAYSANLLEQVSFEKLYISVFHLADEFHKLTKNSEFPWEFEVLRESEPLGTAGALGLIEDNMTDNLYVLNADVVSSLQLCKMRIFHDLMGNDITVGVVRHQTTVPFGVTRYRGFGEFEQIEEKPQYQSMISAGINIVSRKSSKLIAKGEAIDMPDFLRKAREAEHRVSVFPIYEDWRDVGTLQSLDEFRAQEN